MFWVNFKMAFAALRSSKARSLLTMLGVIIGVASVVTVVSIGEGVKSQVNGEINRLGRDLVNISPGNTVTRDEDGEITDFNFAASFGASNLTEDDLETVQNVENVRLAVPISNVTGSVSVAGNEVSDSLIIATEPGFIEILNREVAIGDFLNDDITNSNAVVIGASIAENYLGGPESSLGRKVTVRAQEFTVIGVMAQEEPASPLQPIDFNNAVYIPFETGKDINNGAVFISEINARIDDADRIDETVARITEALIENHGGEEDFSVIKQEEALQITDNILGLVTTLVAGIAGISLFVGGIGIMNIMLAAVTERTYETGIRKSIGATNQQIRSQFLIESVVLSVIGGIIGVLLSLVITLAFRTYTDLEPKITLPVIIIATTVSTVVGVIFGTLPAIKASRKNPIEALRRI